jgi:hypothetical protein
MSRRRRLLFPLAAALFLAVAATALVAPVEAAKPQPQPGCNEYCKPFVVAPGFGKCYFRGCDAEGDCLYLC